jgi:twinkle protein
MFGMERNQQAECQVEKTTTSFRVLKDRYTGQATGEVIKLGYNAETGCLYELPPEEKQQEANFNNKSEEF